MIKPMVGGSCSIGGLDALAVECGISEHLRCLREVK